MPAAIRKAAQVAMLIWACLGLSLSLTAAPGVFRFLTTDLPHATTKSNYNTRLVVANATGPVTFAAVPNPQPLPDGLTLDPETGFITGIPTASTNAHVLFQATDDTGTIDLDFVMQVSDVGNEAIYFPLDAMADGTVGQAYAFTITVAGGTGPFTYITEGLPLGLDLNGTTGAVSGIPGEAGTFPVVMTAYDTSDDTKTAKIIGITILPATSAFRFTNLLLDNGEVGSSYHDQYLAEDGAVTTVTYAAAGLPPGLACDSLTGAVTGTPTTPGTFLVEVSANDGTDTITFSQHMIIAPSPVSELYWEYYGLPAGIRNVPYTNLPAVTLVVGGRNPSSNMAYTATGLPTGIAYNITSGELSGTPTAPVGIYPVTFTATDSGTDPPEVIVLNADIVVMGAGGGDTKSLGANFFVLKQGLRCGVPGRDSWSATVLYNADRCTGLAFDPTVDTFRLALGSKEIVVGPGEWTVKSPVLYTYKSVPDEVDPVVHDVKLLADKQLVKIKTKYDTLIDAVPGELSNLLQLGDMAGRIKEYLGADGKFNILTGYHNTGFAAAKAKLIRKGVGLDSAQLQLYLASPVLSYATGDSVRIRLLDTLDNVLLDKDATLLIAGTRKVDAATGVTIIGMGKAVKDESPTDVLRAFKYDTKKGKMTLKVAAMDLGALADAEENVVVEVVINGTAFSTTLTLFDPLATGKYSEKMPK